MAAQFQLTHHIAEAVIICASPAVMVCEGGGGVMAGGEHPAVIPYQVSDLRGSCTRTDEAFRQPVGNLSPRLSL